MFESDEKSSMLTSELYREETVHVDATGVLATYIQENRAIWSEEVINGEVALFVGVVLERIGEVVDFLGVVEGLDIVSTSREEQSNGSHKI